MMMTFASLVIAVCSVIAISYAYPNKYVYFFISDSNKILAVMVAATSFLWFKNMNIHYSKIINIAGASTFGVLLIHANSDAMRQWLWKDVVDCVGHYSLSPLNLILYFIGTIFLIFTICTIIDIIRIQIIEKPFFRWYDKKFSLR